jgi:hypothetical protein
VAEWYRENGKHEVYAGGREVEMESTDHSLVIRAEDAERVRERGELPLTASDEERQARKAEREAEKAREIYEEMVLGKKPSKLDLIKIEVLNRRDDKEKEMSATGK